MSDRYLPDTTFRYEMDGRVYHITYAEIAEQIRSWSAPPSPAAAPGEYDPEAGTCTYCHGIGACPKCWGRVQIDALRAALAAAVDAARQEERCHTQATIDATRAEYAPLVAAVREWQEAHGAHFGMKGGTAAEREAWHRVNQADQELFVFPLPEGGV